jgi:glycosyltransferase involved in cell wall biosynthesis
MAKCDQLDLNNYKKQLANIKNYNLLFVESAWRGYKNQWNLARISKNAGMNSALNEIIATCKKYRVPTVFWGKEDPVMFNRFLPVAAKFDVILTTDKGSEPQYKKLFPAKKTMTFPFAAQSSIHNILGDCTKNDFLCFAGSNWGSQFKEREADMKHILLPATQYNLHIYNRKDVGGAGGVFPPEYAKFVVPGVPYTRLVEVYKKYKIFLNLNSVKHSETMFARRVFEILACGTPVISSYSLGIEKMFGDTVCLSTSVEQTKREIDRLLNDSQYYDQKRLDGIKKVFANHTYSHRFYWLCRLLGIYNKKISSRVQLANKISTLSSIDDISNAMKLLV